MTASAAFGGGLVAALIWPSDAGVGYSLSAIKIPTAPGSSGSGKATAPASPGNSLPGPEPTLDEVLNAKGLDRTLLMTRFIQGATPAQLAEVIARFPVRRSQGLSDLAALAWARYVEIDPAGALKSPNAGQGWAAYAKLDPQAALAAAAGKVPAIRSMVVAAIAESDPALARQLLAETEGLDAAAVSTGILRGLARSDPAAAAAMALGRVDHDLKPQFANWLRLDREAARAWMLGITDPMDRRRLEDIAFTDQVADDPAAAVNEAAALPAGLRQATQMIEALAALALQDPAAAKAAAAAIPTRHTRARALGSVMDTLIPTNPAAAVAMIPSFDWAALGNSGVSEVYMLGGSSSYSLDDISKEALIRKLMVVDPRATAEAFAALPPSNESLLFEAMQNWTSIQPEESSAWLRDQPSGPQKDEAITSLMHWLTSENGSAPDYAGSLEWANVFTRERRMGEMGGILARWTMRGGEEAARSAVESLPVKEEERAQLLNELNKTAESIRQERAQQKPQ